MGTCSRPLRLHHPEASSRPASRSGRDERRSPSSPPPCSSRRRRAPRLLHPPGRRLRGRLRRPERRPRLAATIPAAVVARTAAAPPPTSASTADAASTAYQIHSAIAAGRRRPLGRAPGRRATRWSRRTPGVICGALAADCAPVLMADPGGPRGRPPPTPAGRARWAAWSRRPSPAWSASAPIAARMVAAVGPCIGPAVLRGRPGVPRPASSPPTAGLRRASSPLARPTTKRHVRPAGLRARAAEAAPGSRRRRDGSAATPAPTKSRFFSNRRGLQGGRGRLRPAAVGHRAERLPPEGQPEFRGTRLRARPCPPGLTKGPRTALSLRGILDEAAGRQLQPHPGRRPSPPTSTSR